MIRPQRSDATQAHQLTAPAPRLVQTHRARVHGKSFFLGEQPLVVRGVTYGPFRPHEEHGEYGSPEAVARDMAAMVEVGINVVRTYTLPPMWLLDLARQHGLLVMVGLAWQQHTAFLDDRKLVRKILADARQQARDLADHPALFAIAIGNEIPARIVRWHGRRRVEDFLRAVGVGETLTEVDRLGADGQCRHLGEDRLAELTQAGLDVGITGVLHDGDGTGRAAGRLQLVSFRGRSSQPTGGSSIGISTASACHREGRR